MLYSCTLLQGSQELTVVGKITRSGSSLMIRKLDIYDVTKHGSLLRRRLDMKVCKYLTYFLDFIFYFLAHCIIFSSLLEHDWAAIWRLECQPEYVMSIF